MAGRVSRAERDGRRPDCYAQKVEHYEIASYGCLVTWAQQLDLSDDAVSLLKQNLGEEKETDEKLTRLAEDLINARAAAGR